MKRCLPLLFLLLLMAAPTALAQETILIGENKLGEISATNPQPAYLFNAQTNQTVEIEILGVSAGLAPTITLLTPQGAVLQFIGNPTNASSVKGTVTFTQAGTYTIQVATSNGSQGQFVISVTDTAPQIPPTPLNLDETVTGEVASTQRIAYSFTSAPDAPLVLNFTRVEGPLGLKVELNRADSTPVALLSSELLSTSLTLPPGDNIAYLLIITNETPDSLPIGYTLNLTKAAPTDTTALPELPTTGACVLATQGQVINVRPGPGTNYNPPITTIPASGVYNVVGRNEDSSWWKINYGGGEGWVGGGVTRRGGNCSNVPVVSYPPPPPTETQEATEQPGQGGGQPTEEATEAAPPQATEEVQAPAAGNNSQTVDVNIKNFNNAYSGAISYPNGVNSDTVTIRVSGFDSITTSGNVTYTLTCTGTGSENVVVNGGGLSRCGSSATRFYTNDSNQDRITISINTGNNVYIQWSLVISASN